MAVYVAPGVYVREIDLSLYIPALSTTIVGMVGRATKGPVNARTYVTNQQQFVDTFGAPDPTVGYESYAALQYLRRGSQLWYVRIVGPAAAKATHSFVGTDTTEVTGETLYSSTVPDGVEEHFNSQACNNLPVVPYSVTVSATSGGDTITASDNGSGTITGTHFSGTIVYTTGVINLTFAADYVPDNDTAITVSYSYYASTTTYTAEVLASQAHEGTEVTFTGTLDHYPVVPGSVTVTATVGSSSKTATDPLGHGVLTGTGYASGSVVYNTGIVTVTLSVAADEETDITVTYKVPRTATVFSVTAASEGEWGNNVSVEITAGTVEDSFRLNVYHEDVLVERWNNLVLDDASDNFIETIVGTVADPVSDYITVDASAATSGDYPLWVDPTALAGGDSDAESITAADVIGVAFDEGTASATGLQLLASPSAVDINLITAPGWSEAAIVTELLSISEARADCFAIIDPPEDLTPAEVVDWHNGQGAWAGDHEAFNSSYGAVYYPWIKVYDAYSRDYVYTPPSGHVLAVYAYNDQVGESWYAPAGINRGRVVSGIELAYNPTHGEVELMYGDGNAVNPIEGFPKDGIVVWGQRTLQRLPTALDRVNVRRLLLYIRKAVATATRALVFEPNDQKTWKLFAHMVVPFLNDLTQRRGLYDFRVRCDETTNTPDVIDRNEMRAQILVKPVKAAEFIQVDVVITATGANFDEILY